jgi:hypothetical protein
MLDIADIKVDVDAHLWRKVRETGWSGPPEKKDRLIRRVKEKGLAGHE